MEQAEQAGRPYGVTYKGKESRRQHSDTSLLGTLTQVLRFLIQAEDSATVLSLPAACFSGSKAGR